MTLNEYQNGATEFAVYPKEMGLMYTALALNEEAGEYAGKIAKYVRGDRALDKELAAKELGDTLWQTSQAARELGYSLDDIAKMNLDKLYARKLAGTIKGSGDVR